jgi:hypothetical protein
MIGEVLLRKLLPRGLSPEKLLEQRLIQGGGADATRGRGILSGQKDRLNQPLEERGGSSGRSRKQMAEATRACLQALGPTPRWRCTCSRLS